MWGPSAPYRAPAEGTYCEKNELEARGLLSSAALLTLLCQQHTPSTHTIARILGAVGAGPSLRCWGLASQRARPAGALL